MAGQICAFKSKNLLKIEILLELYETYVVLKLTQILFPTSLISFE